MADVHNTITFVEVLCCDVATRRVQKRYISTDGRLLRLEMWDGDRWVDPMWLLENVEVQLP